MNSYIFKIIFLFFISLSMRLFSTPAIGYLDVAHPEDGCQGWALDPDNTNANITIHFYENMPAGSPGSVYLGSTVANRPRQDVNNVTGFPGNHGFLWKMPIELTTPCPIAIYAYGIDLNNEPNSLLNDSPKLMPLLIKTISSNSITIKASSQYAGAIYSLVWNGKEFIDNYDHGRLLQSASSFYSSINSWTAECYNPTEAGSNNNGNSICTDSRIIDISNLNQELYTKTQMAFFAASGINNGTSSCPTPKNTIVTSHHIVEKFVKIGMPNLPNVINYKVSFTIPYNETYLALGQFEALTGYLKKEFNTIFQYNQTNQTLIQTNNLPNGEYNKPIVISTSDGNYAMGIYSPEIKINPLWGQGYGQFQCPLREATTKWNFVRRIPNVVGGSTYTFNAFVCVGNLENVRYSISQLINLFPNN